MRKLAITFGLVTMVFGTAACNTVQGVGEDISSVGRAGEEVIN